MKLGVFPGGALVLAIGLSATFAARADTVDTVNKTVMTDRPVDRLAPAALIEGPSLRETGRVGVLAPEDPSGISGGKDLAVQPEKNVAPAAAAADIGNAAPPAGGSISEAVLADQIATRFATLDDCRIEVARNKQVLPAGVVANTLVLRWTIFPDGHAGMTSVVATAPTDDRVMDCVKAKMQRWSFAEPRGGPVQVERTFSFRAMPEPR
jgi:hypothetical protein